MSEILPEVRYELAGWTLLWARLAMVSGDEAALRALAAEELAAARRAFTLETLSQHPTVAAVRTLFRQAGCDPTRYRPSSEALLRRVLKGEDLAPILPAVDLNNLLSIAMAVPSCVIGAQAVRAPLVLRAGRAGERMQSMRGDFDLEGKPLLADAQGPFGTPITDSERVKVTSGSSDVLLVAYLPETCNVLDDVRATLRRLIDRSGLVTLVALG